MQCLAHGGSALVALAVARARLERQRNLAADPGIPRANDRCATQRGFDRRPCAAAGGNDPLQPGSYRDQGRGPARGNGLRVLPRGRGEARPVAEATGLAVARRVRNETIPKRFENEEAVMRIQPYLHEI